MSTRTIMVISSDPSDIESLEKELKTEGYEVAGITGSEEVEKLLTDNRPFALAVVFISGFDERIWEICRRFHEVKMPYIAVASHSSREFKRNGMKYGASCLLVKPLATRELIEHVHATLGE